MTPPEAPAEQKQTVTAPTFSMWGEIQKSLTEIKEWSKERELRSEERAKRAEGLIEALAVTVSQLAIRIGDAIGEIGETKGALPGIIAHADRLSASLATCQATHAAASDALGNTKVAALQKQIDESKVREATAAAFRRTIIGGVIVSAFTLTAGAGLGYVLGKPTNAALAAARVAPSASASATPAAATQTHP